MDTWGILNSIFKFQQKCKINNQKKKLLKKGLVIESIFSDVPREKLQHIKDRPIMAASLDPDYHRNGNKEYVCGGRAEEIGLVKKGQWPQKSLFSQKVN